MNSQGNEFDTSQNRFASAFIASFRDHPASVGETYFTHLLFALGFSLRLFAAGLAALVHAFIPAWFETTASRQVISIRDDLVNRHEEGGNR